MARCVKKIALKRASRVRYKLKLRADGRFRLSIFRSANNIYAQVIDDTQGFTVASASTLEKGWHGKKNRCNVESAKKLGAVIASRLLSQQIEEVVFDRGPYLYHGKIKALADAAREGGLKF